MGIKYIRQGQEPVKECSNCCTVWKDSWINNELDKNECPFCGYMYHENYRIVFKRFKSRNDLRCIKLETVPKNKQIIIKDPMPRIRTQTVEDWLISRTYTKPQPDWDKIK